MGSDHDDIVELKVLFGTYVESHQHIHDLEEKARELALRGLAARSRATVAVATMIVALAALGVAILGLLLR